MREKREEKNKKRKESGAGGGEREICETDVVGEMRIGWCTWVLKKREKATKRNKMGIVDL
jgi:hypothetical protein